MGFRESLLRVQESLAMFKQLTLCSTFAAVTAFSCLLVTDPVQGQEQIQQISPRKIPPARRSYMGREIAQTMHYTGAPWLIRENRENEERCSIMLGNLGVKIGMTICDMGCGNGFYSLQLGNMVGPEGRILAVDVQPQMLYLLRARMEKEALENVTPILGSFHNPHLPKNTIDLILMVDVYHELSHPEVMLKYMRDSLKEDGQIVLLEYREEDPKVPIKPLHKMSKKQILKEYQSNGFKLTKEFDKLPWQHMMFFGKDPEWEEKSSN